MSIPMMYLEVWVTVFEELSLGEAKRWLQNMMSMKTSRGVKIYE